MVELRRRRRVMVGRIESNARDADALRRRARELDATVARDRERVKRHDEIIAECEKSLDRIIESSEFLLSELTRETQGLDLEADVEE